MVLPRILVCLGTRNLSRLLERGGFEGFSTSLYVSFVISPNPISFWQVKQRQKGVGPWQ